jgi:multidrug efflux pump subunit AcrA (membrane-fusion protein)
MPPKPSDQRAAELRDARDAAQSRRLEAAAAAEVNTKRANEYRALAAKAKRRTEKADREIEEIDAELNPVDGKLPRNFTAAQLRHAQRPLEGLEILASEIHRRECGQCRNGNSCGTSWFFRSSDYDYWMQRAAVVALARLGSE